MNNQLQYVELEFEKGDVYKGQINVSTGSLDGLCFFSKKGRSLTIGSIKDGLISGPVIHIDLSENTLYQGFFKSSLKDGPGTLHRFKTPQAL